MRGNRLARGAMTVIAITVSVAGMATGIAVGSPGAASAAVLAGQQQAYRAAYESFDQRAANYVQTLEGIPYLYGGTGRGGFDCSGLTQYVYGHLGRSIARTAEDQFLQFRRISHRRAWGGDLVFFHVTSDPNSYVYHVGVYEGGDYMVGAPHTGSYVRWEWFGWAGDTVTFGTITH